LLLDRWTGTAIQCVAGSALYQQSLIVNRDEARRIAANIAKLPELALRRVTATALLLRRSPLMPP
jgi:hypothetical protein